MLKKLPPFSLELIGLLVLGAPALNSIKDLKHNTTLIHDKAKHSFFTYHTPSMHMVNLINEINIIINSHEWMELEPRSNPITPF